MIKLHARLFAATLCLTACAHHPPGATLKEYQKTSEESRVDSTVITYSNGAADVLKLMKLKGKITNTEFHDRVNNQKAYLQRLFKINIEPYFGHPDKDVECVKQLDLNPPEIQNATVNYVKFELGATKDYVYGTCNPKLEVLRSQFWLIYCKEEQLYFEVRTFSPLANPLNDGFGFSSLCKTGSLH